MASTHGQDKVTLSGDGDENRKSQEGCGGDAPGTSSGFSPEVVASWIYSSNAGGTSQPSMGAAGRSDRQKAEQAAVTATGKLPQMEYLNSYEAQGNEHVVWYRDKRVEKHQRRDAYMPVLRAGKIGLDYAVPSEYLRRLELQNELFGDGMLVVGLTRGNRFVITQPILAGGEPTELEIRHSLESVGWKRIPINLQDLPYKLMGAAWWHPAEEVIMLDARKPNFKKTESGAVLPIDLILADLTVEMRELLGS